MDLGCAMKKIHHKLSWTSSEEGPIEMSCCNWPKSRRYRSGSLKIVTCGILRADWMEKRMDQNLAWKGLRTFSSGCVLCG